jgi:hypothetical protein
VTVAASRRLLVVRAAIHPAVPMGRLLLRAPRKRALALTVAQTLSRVKEQGKVRPIIGSLAPCSCVLTYGANA